jgi:hypothetical protein
LLNWVLHARFLFLLCGDWEVFHWSAFDANMTFELPEISLITCGLWLSNEFIFSSKIYNLVPLWDCTHSTPRTPGSLDIHEFEE